MGRFTVRLPKTLHQEIDLLAKGEGISLNQYIVYALTEKVTQTKLTTHPVKVTARQTDYSITQLSATQIAEQKAAYQTLLTRLGNPASDVELAQFLSDRELAEPEPDLEPEAIAYMQAQIARANSE